MEHKVSGPWFVTEVVGCVVIGVGADTMTCAVEVMLRVAAIQVGMKTGMMLCQFSPNGAQEHISCT